MHLPRVRFTVRRMMVAVVVVAVLIPPGVQFGQRFVTCLANVYRYHERARHKGKYGTAYNLEREREWTRALWKVWLPMPPDRAD